MPSYDQTRFRSTHNSYSGDHAGARGSIPEQLGRGVRCLELDFHDSGYVAAGDFRVGHFTAGHEAATGLPGNPGTILLRDWLEVVARWRAGQPGHAPIAVVLDSKDDLLDNAEGGDLTDLNDLVRSVFGGALFTREDFDRDGWADVDHLRGRVLCVLSGHGATRSGYRYAWGASPSVAVNAEGQVVLAYLTPAGDLVCWTGQADAEEVTTAWHRQATYAWGAVGLVEPAVAINEDGWVVAVHRSVPPQGMELPRVDSRLGRAQDDGRIAWFGTQTLGRGVTPTVRIEGDEVREIHLRPAGTGPARQKVTGRIDRRRRRIDWKNPRATDDLPFVRDVARADGFELSARANAGVVSVAVGEGPLHPVRLPQLLFVEIQSDTEALATPGDTLFFANGAGNVAALTAARVRGLVARGWGFRQEHTGGPVVNFPAADDLAGSWYDQYMTAGDVAE